MYKKYLFVTVIRYFRQVFINNFWTDSPVNVNGRIYVDGSVLTRVTMDF